MQAEPSTRTMSGCWVDLETNPVSFHIHDTLRELEANLSSPSTQYPSLITCLYAGSISEKSKEPDSFLNSINANRNSQSWTFYVHETSMENLQPLLYTSSYIESDEETPPTSRIVRDLFYHFTDVFVCIATSLEGSAGILNFLSETLSSVTTLRVARPQLLIVEEEMDVPVRFPIESWLKVLSPVFSRIRVVGREASVHSAVAKASAAMQRDLARVCMQFNFVHFSDLLEQAIAHLASGDPTPPDIISSTRKYTPVPNSFIANWKQVLDDTNPADKLSKSFVLKYIASTMVFDCYPIGAHAFKPSDSFRILYHNHLSEALNDCAVYGDKAREISLRTVEKHFQSLSAQTRRSPTRSGAIVHYDLIRKSRPFCTRLVIKSSCPICLTAPRDFILPCDHGFCRPCARIFGNQLENSVTLSNCLWCGSAQEDVELIFKPPTAGIRILTIDGGGVRGIIPLQFLKILQQFMNLDCQIQEFFDIAIGTSSGGLITLGLFLHGWSVEDCEKAFISMSQEAFKPRTFFGMSPTGRLQKILLSLWADSHYSQESLKDALIKSFGSKRTLQSYSYASRTSCNVGVTATATDHSQPVIFSNYNIPRKPEGYQVLASDHELNAINIVDAALSTSAAPWYFPSHKIENLGEFMDGGLCWNNPTGVAVREMRRIWPEHTVPDTLISIGTGISSTPESPTNPQPAIKWGKAFVQLFSTFMSSLDGEKIWNEWRHTVPLPFRQKAHRLNALLDDSQPRLDDLPAIRELKSQAMSKAISMTEDIRKITAELVASLFYVEFLDRPCFQNSEYTCYGRIYCRLTNSAAEKTLVNRLRNNFSKFWVNGVETPFPQASGSPFHVDFTLRTRSLQVDITIRLGTAYNESIDISGLPKTLETLLSLQMMHCIFGFKHAIKRQRSDSTTSIQKRSRRKCTQ